MLSHTSSNIIQKEKLWQIKDEVFQFLLTENAFKLQIISRLQLYDLQYEKYALAYR